MSKEAPQRIAGIYTEERAEAIKEAAQEFGFDFRIVATSRKGYSLANGGSIQFFVGEDDPVVPEGMVVGSLPIEAELTEGFWEKVSEIQNSSVEEDKSRIAE